MKVIKRIKKILIIVLLLMVVISAGLLLFLKSSWGQQKVLHYVTNRISKDLGVAVSFRDLKINFFNDFVLSGFYLEDQMGDTLIFVEEVKGEIELMSLRDKQLSFSKLILNKPFVQIKIMEGDTINSMQFVVDKYFKRELRKKESKWLVSIKAVEIEDGVFRNDNYNSTLKDRFDLNHLVLSDVGASIDQIDIVKNKVALTVKRLKLKEKSGFHLDSLSASLMISDIEMKFDELLVKTPQSYLKLDGQLQYEKGSYLKNFQSDVYIVGNLEEGSIVNSSDLAYFFKGLENTNEKLVVSGKVIGNVNRLKGKELDIKFGKRSTFKGNMSFDGLPDIEKAFINFKVKELLTDYRDIKSLNLSFLKPIVEALPDKMGNLGKIRFDGNFTGFTHDFVAYGNFYSNLGPVHSNLALVRNEKNNQYRIKGKISTRNFNIKGYTGNDNWGNISANLNLDATGSDLKKLAANLKGSIEHIDYKGYIYENLLINGLLDKNLFTGELSGNEPNLAFDFRGTINLVESIPLFDFKMKVDHANPAALRLSGLENWTNVSGEITTTLRGNNIDNLIGEAGIKNLIFQTTSDSVFVDSVYFSASSLSDGFRKIELKSRVLDAEILGEFKSKNVVPGIMSMLQDIMPSWYANEYQMNDEMNLQAKFKFKETKDVLAVFLPGINISNDAALSIDINPKDKKFLVVGTCDSLLIQTVKLSDFKITAERYSDRAYLMLENKETQVSEKLGFNDNIFTAYMYNDSLESDLTWSTLGLNSSGFFSTLTVFDSLTTGVTEFLPSDLIVNNNYWSIVNTFPVNFNGKEIDIPIFEIESEDEKLKLIGKISENPEEKLNLNFEGFQLDHLNDLVRNKKFSIDGVADLNASISNVYNNLGVEANLNIDNISLMDRAIGNLSAHSKWHANESYLDVDGTLINNGVKTFDLKGKYNPNEEIDKLDASMAVKELDLSFLELINASGVSDFGGYATGNLNVGGHFTEPDINGTLFLDKAKVKIDFLNTSYTFSDNVKISKDLMQIDNVSVFDEMGNIAFVNGGVIHENFRKWNYDFYAVFDSLLCFNLSKGMNENFYGRAFAEGSASISGFGSNVYVEVEAKSKKGTVVDIPLGEVGDVKLENFITFVNPNEQKVAYEADLSGLDLNLNMDINRDALIRLIFDEQIGDVMEGRGNGLINMEIDSRGDFSMIGNYTIEEGQYLFTLKNIINKRFAVEKGGTITWFGDPYEALIDIDAVYKVRTSLLEFSPENTEWPSRNVLILCKMNLKNRLLNPDIELEIDVPNVSPNIKSQAVSRINSELELNRQFFSLLVLNKFLLSQSSSGTSGFSAIDAGVNTGVEFLANQLSNWLSQISTDIDIGVNYSPGDQITNQELAVALSTQLFNERLLVTGNLGVSEGNGITGNKSSLIGDFIVEYMLTPEGRLRLKVFNETNDFNITTTDQAGTTQGIGVVIFREFDPLIK